MTDLTTERHKDSKRVAKKKVVSYVEVTNSLLYNMGGDNYISLHATDSVLDLVLIYIHDLDEWEAVNDDRPLQDIADGLTSTTDKKLVL